MDPRALLALPSTAFGGEVEEGPLKTSQVPYFRLAAVSELALTEAVQMPPRYTELPSTPSSKRPF